MPKQSASSSTIAVVAEKPSVARDIAKVLGANQKGNGYLHGGGYIVTWAIGHLVALAQPHEIRPEWRQWRRHLLPMLPEEWPLVVYEKTKDQFEIVRKIITSAKVGQIVCATDAGREGELIFRYIYDAAQSAKSVQRLWISSLTSDAIRQGFADLKSAREYDGLGDAARGRSRADWLVGMNLSRAYTLAYDEEISVGRVQTPTLAMVVERELAVRSFVPEEYREVVATFSPQAFRQATSQAASKEKNRPKYQGTWFRPSSEGAAKQEKEKQEKENLQQSMRLPVKTDDARNIVARALAGEARILSVQSEAKRMAPPQLYDLTELQRHANRLYGLNAQQTLDIAQALYEKHKLLSYPRTDSRHLAYTVAQTLPNIVRVIGPRYPNLLAPGTGQKPLGPRFVDDAKVSDHHAIIPTVTSPERTNLTEEERRIYDLVCRRLLSAWHDDYISDVTTVITTVTNPGFVDHFHATGMVIRQLGWKVLDIGGGGENAKAATKTKKPRKTKEAAEETPEAAGQTLPPGLAAQQLQDVLDAESVLKKTRPPKRLTDATLLTAMQTAGKTLDEKELSDAMKDSGLGTPATRASMIEVLLKRGYIQRQGKALEATDKGIHLIEVVHPEVKSPAMTGQWEAYLKRIERGSAGLPPFLAGINQYVSDVVGKVIRTEVRKQTSKHTNNATRNDARSPLHQAVVAGRDLLMVSPAGAGKSLCDQLAGLTLAGFTPAGTTLVFSSLIPEMDSDVAKLKDRGISAERIHAECDRAASREVCIRYLQGKLQFLFIAPERLSVPGFVEMLAKRKPSLVAIEQAHCLSQASDDFRPDYRTLAHHLRSLRPALMIAVSTSATLAIQEEIKEQLGLLF